MKKLFLSLSLFVFGSAYADGPAVHGMVVFGDQTLYASHVPMFHKPHDYQAIFKIALASHGDKAYRKNAFLEAKQQLLTVMPKPFVLPDLLSGKIKGFTADLYLGNFEDGGVKIASNVVVTVTEVVFQSRLALSTSPTDLSYLVLEGKYAVHLIRAPQSFDEIFELESPTPAGVQVSEGVKDELNFRLGQGKAFYCTVGPDFAAPCPH